MSSEPERKPNVRDPFLSYVATFIKFGLILRFSRKSSRDTLFEEDLIKSKSYILHGLVCNLLTKARATFRVRLKLPGQHEVVVAALFFSWSFSFTGELEHMVLLYFLLFFFRYISGFSVVVVSLQMTTAVRQLCSSMCWKNETAAVLYYSD